MSQSTITVGALFVMFVVYVTIQGKLAQYLGVFGFAGAPAQTAPGSTSSTGTPLNPGGTQFNASAMGLFNPAIASDAGPNNFAGQ